jgi:hypothetical protein
MERSGEHRVCSICLEGPLSSDLQTVGLCLNHFAESVERTCNVMQRQIAARKLTPANLEQLVSYIGGCVLLLCQTSVGVSLPGELKDSVVEAFRTLIQLRESLNPPIDSSLFGFPPPARHDLLQAPRPNRLQMIA